MRLARSWTRGAAAGRHRIFPDLAGVNLARRLAQPLPQRGLTPARLLAELKRDLLPFLRDSGHPAFFGYVMSPPSGAGVAADLLASAFDQNLTAWRSAPGPTEMERLVVDWLRQITGLPEGSGGLLTSGGSMATLAALSVARAVKAPAGTVRGGLGLLGDRLMTLYSSDEVHMSVPRAAQILGLGTAAVRIVPSDARFRLDPAGLEDAVLADRRAGHLPFCVVASAGTVNTGAVDPLEAIARLARKHRLWLHVDAAYGGPLGLSALHRPLLRGLEEADSVALDPHKWLYAPLDAGCVLYRDPATARAAFSARGEYAQIFETGERESFAFFEHGPELSRRFRALKVWMILKYHGAERLGQRLAEEMALATHLARLVQNHAELELLAPVETGIVCFRYMPPASRPAAAPRAAVPDERRRGGRGGDDRGRRAADAMIDRLNQDLLVALQRGGRVYLSNALLRGRFALRACLVNFRTRRTDLERLVQEVVREGRRLTTARRGR